MEVARLDGAVAEQHDRDPIGATQPRRQRVAERERDVPADDAGRAEQTVLGVDQVHRAAEPAAEAVDSTHQLGHHPLKRRALGDRVPVRAVAGVDDVVCAELAADPRGDALAADAEVDQPVDPPRPRELRDALLETPDPAHRFEQSERGAGVQRRHGELRP